EAGALEHPVTSGIALQAYGETGNLPQMLASYRELERELAAPARAHLELAAYLGSESAFELALVNLPALPPQVGAYFRGVLLQATGERLAARAPLQEAEAHPGLQRRALARLRRPLEPVATLPLKMMATVGIYEHSHTVSLALYS